MNKLKHTIAFFLAALTVVLCAFLPRMVSAAGDRSTLGQSGSRWMQAVQFEIHRNIPALGKLSIASGSELVLIPESKAQMTAQQVSDAFSEAVTPYIDAGLMEEYTPWQQSIRPLLVQKGDLSSIFWSVSIICDASETYTIDALIDDETGLLLGISVLDQQLRGSALRNEYLHTFADLFFTALGIPDHDSAEASVEQDLATGINTLGYCFQDPVYGKVELKLTVYEYGFFVEVPQENIAYEGK